MKCFRYRTTLKVLILSLLTIQIPSSADYEVPPELKKQLESTLVSLNANIGEEPTRFHHNRAEVLFRLGRFEESIRDYDKAARLGWPHDEYSCWERGLAQYYVRDFKNAAQQFARYHSVGALDIENGLWRLLCIAEDEGIEKARATMLEYSRKVRVPFPALLELYLGRGTVLEVLDEAKHGITDNTELNNNLFNAHYYIGKYYELTDDTEQARKYFEIALTHPIPHFMYVCAQIDLANVSKSTQKEKR